MFFKEKELRLRLFCTAIFMICCFVKSFFLKYARIFLNLALSLSFQIKKKFESHRDNTQNKSWTRKDGKDIHNGEHLLLEGQGGADLPRGTPHHNLHNCTVSNRLRSFFS